MKELTDRQQQVLQFIRTFTEERSFPPTVREIAGHFHISVKAAQDHLSALRKKNYLAQGEKRSRALEILVDDDSCRRPQLVGVPLIGTVAAGMPLSVIEDYENTLYLPQTLLRSGRQYFALHVRGDSMINAGILDGDTAVIEQCETASNGDIVVAVVNEAITLKRFFKEPARVRLQPENPAYNPIFCQNLRIVGKLTTIIRNY